MKLAVTATTIMVFLLLAFDKATHTPSLPEQIAETEARIELIKTSMKSPRLSVYAGITERTPENEVLHVLEQRLKILRAELEKTATLARNPQDPWDPRKENKK